MVEAAAGELDVGVAGEVGVTVTRTLDAVVLAAVDAADDEVGEYPGGGGATLKAGDKLTLLELVSSVILNLYCWVVGTSAGMERIALPRLGSTAMQSTLSQHRIDRSGKG